MKSEVYFDIETKSFKSRVNIKKPEIKKEQPEKKTRFCWIELITNLGTFKSKELEVSESEFLEKQVLIDRWAAGFYTNNAIDKKIEVHTLTIQLEDNSFLSANTALLKNAIIILRHKSNIDINKIACDLANKIACEVVNG